MLGSVRVFINATQAMYKPQRYRSVNQCHINTIKHSMMLEIQVTKSVGLSETNAGQRSRNDRYTQHLTVPLSTGCWLHRRILFSSTGWQL